MNSKNLLVLIAVGVGAYLFFKSYIKQFADGIKYISAKAKFGSITLNGVNITITLSFQNNNSIAVPIDSFEGSVYYGNAKLSNLKLISPVLLLPNGLTTNINLNSAIDLLSVSKDIRDLIINKQYLNQLIVKGIIYIKGKSFDVDYKLDII